MMRNRSGCRTAILALACAGAVLANCAPTAAGTGVLRSALSRERSPEVAPSEMQELVTGEADFALRLYAELRERDGNLFFSPHSISSALAMAYAGARGRTEREMADALGFTLPPDRLHPSFNALDLALASRAGPVESFVGTFDGPELNIANSLWGQADHGFLPEYLDLLALHYGAEVHTIDFRQQAAARREINRWVAGETKGKIKDVIPSGALNARTRLVLVNAIYFKAEWESMFRGAGSDEFYLLDGGKVRVPMMTQDEPFPYVDGPGYQAFELPYVGGDMAMGILVPDSGKFQDIERSLDASTLRRMLADLQRTYLILTMPEFEFESDFDLSETLGEMGMRSAFSGADFSGMDGTRGLELSRILHKSFVSVDRRGTEAAAASTVFAEVVSGFLYPIELTVDRPFIFWIRDLPSGSILFLGRVLNPAK